MKKTNYSISKTMMSVKNLKQAEMLKKYGIDKPSEFEIAQLRKFGLTEHLNGVVATVDGIVLCNWELVLIAKGAGIKEIEVINIDNLTEDEIPQVIAVKNIRKKLTKSKLAKLIIEYREYLTQTDAGKSWAEEIPGDSTDAKIGCLLDYSYGMINGYQAIYNSHPEYLEMMDAGELSYAGAQQLLKEEKAEKENKTCETGAPDVNPMTPNKSNVKAPDYNYAGERNMVACIPVSTIQIVYADGRKMDLIVDGSSAIGQFVGKELNSSYKGVKEAFEGGSEFHRLDFPDQKHFIELVIKMAA